MRSLQWWPTVLAAGLAGFVALTTSRGSDVASVLAASGFVYLGAAALQMRSAAWPAFIVSFLIITAARFGWLGVEATWVLLGVAGLLAVYGLGRGATRPAGGLPLQAAAMAAVGAMAAIAIIISGDTGAYLVAAGLLGHAAWDVHHYRANTVVVRSLAEFCFVLDTLLAVAIVILTVRG
jgi:hypothetical protein